MHGLTHAIVISANEQKIWFRTYGYKVKKAQNENDQPVYIVIIKNNDKKQN